MRLLRLALLFTAILGAQTIGIDSNLNADLNRSINPCVNFYQYSCGTWMAKNPIPSDESIWGRFNVLAEQNRQILRDILEKAAAVGSQRSAMERQIGDYYSACMDEKGVEAKGIGPIRAELDRIAKIGNQAGLTDAIARLHALGANPLFGFSASPDMKNSSIVIAEIDQSGLGLPDRDYYLKTDEKSETLRKQYVAHVQKMFRLLGDSEAAAASGAAVVMRIETEMAKSSLDRVSRRDPVKLYHKMPTAEMMALAPTFEWKKYFRDVKAPAFRDLNVVAPDFFKAMDQLLRATPIEEWKVYLKWHLAHAQASLLPATFVQENFEFYAKTLTGAKELRPRWKRCVALADNQLGEALGRTYVERTFGAEGKERMLKMVHFIEESLGKDIGGLDWMTPETKKYALEKLHAITNKIGYPERWRDYSSLKIVRDDALGNANRANEFEFHRQLGKIGKPVDRGEWSMTPPTVNAYYDPSMNNINFPAGILQPPFFNKAADDALNFGAIGAVIGHELTHGFDDEGRQFDAKGNLRDWWTAEDAKKFEERVECLVQQYSGYTAVDDVKLNGRLTLGENTADNGGVRLAHMALMDSLAAAGGSPAKIDGFTPEQRLFIGWGQIWCQNRTPEAARMRAVVDPHSPGEWRVNGVVSNMPEFQAAFGCQANQPMAPVKQCRVW